MDWVAFGLLLNDNIFTYVITFVVSVIVYYFLFRKMYISVLDPIIFSVIFSCFGFSVVWFLYFTDSIETKYLLSYLFTQIAFWLGLFTFKSLSSKQILKERKIIRLENEDSFLKVFFFISTLLYVFLQLLSYWIIGIPIMLGIHVDIYNNSGGWGIIGRFIDILKPISVFLLLYFIFNDKKGFFIYVYKYVFLSVLLVFFALSGSRSEFMMLGLIFFCFVLLNAHTMKKYFLNIRRLEKKIILVGLFFVFLTIVIQSRLNDENNDSIGIFLFRLVASGDTYYFAYPNGNIENLKTSQPFLALFGDIFSTLRIVPRIQQPQVLGVQLYRMFSDSDQTAGPNARQNVFGYAYFGFYGSIIFSYLIGLVLSFVRNKLFFSLRKNIVCQLFFVLLYTDLVALETDPPMAISNVENMFLIFPCILLVSFFCFIAVNYSSSKIKYA
jgi:oligosaccharide repeat unit polymerase